MTTTGNAHAQTAAQQERAARPIEEIVVTARKREETLQEAPVAISVMTAEAIEDSGISTVGELDSRLPNVGGIDAPPAMRGNGFQPTVRGMQTNYRQIGAESSLGLFIDGAYAGNNANGNRFLPPIERIEFLPGPQSTLFGKNTTIGVMNIVTRKPGDQLEVFAHADIGNDGHRDYGGSVYFPLNEQWSMGVTAGKREYSGYIRNHNPAVLERPDGCLEEDGVTPAPCFGDVYAGVLDGVVGPQMDSWGGNVQLAFRGESTTFDLSLEYSDTERTHQPTAQRIEGFDALPRDVISTAQENTALNDERAATATFVKNFDNDGTLTSITNYRKFHTDQLIDDDSYFYPVVDIYSWITDQDQTSQELRYANTAGIMSYLVGAYWQRQDLYSLRLAEIWEITPNLGWEGEMKNRTLAFFANADFDIGDRWGAELGIRHGSETREMPYFDHDLSDLGFWQGTLSGKKKSDRISFTGALTFAPTDTLNTHLRFSRGYKSGGFGLEFFTFTVAPPESAWQFDEERADSWEMGFKWQATDALWLNATLFWTDFTDLQVNQLISLEGQPVPYFSIGNADEARTKGIEVSATYQAERLTLNASAGYNKANYIKWLRPAGLDDEGNDIFEDMAGREFSTPRKTANLIANYRLDLAGRELNLIGEYQYRDGVAAGVGEDQALFIPSVNQINARLRYHINEQFSLTLWGRNLTDRRTVTGRSRNLQAGLIAGGAGWYLPLDVGAGIDDQITGGLQPPRQYGLKLDYEF